MATASDVCGLCFKEPVFGFCVNCSIRLGERCYSKHSKIVIFTGHTVFPLDNIDYKKLVPVEKDIHEQKCQMHATDPQSFYCGKHEVTICGRCLLIDHKTCTNEIVDLHTTTFDEHKTDELIDSLKEIEEEIKDLCVRVDKNVKLNDELKASSMDAIKEYRNKIDSRLDQLQLVAEQATQDRHKENMNILIDIEQTCQDICLRTQERVKIIEELSKKKHERHLFTYSIRLVSEIDDIRTAVQQSNIKNHITTFTFKEHPSLYNTLQKEILELGTIQNACDGSEEIIETDDINLKLTVTPENADESCAGESTKLKSFAFGCQPPGKMTVSQYDIIGRICVKYKFVDGQLSDGKSYKGITETAYIPTLVEGNNICRMLKVAFQRKLLFTINCDGEIVYNEIKLPISSLRWAKSDFERVTAQLEAKGITLADIDSNDNLMGTVIVA